MSKLVCGVGICDIRSGFTVNGKQVQLKSYRCWRSMIQRCYSPKVQAMYQTYIGCSVSKEWLTYSNFKTFYDANYVEGWHLDKDLLVDGNKIYSIDYCVFVPAKLNSLLTDSAAIRGECPIGVSFDKQVGKYKAGCSVNGKSHNIGRYTTPEDASQAYQVFKKGYVLGEIAAYRESYSDNQSLMNLLGAIENRINR